MPELRLAKLPDRTPLKITISLPPDLNQALTDYAAIYAETYGPIQRVCRRGRTFWWRRGLCFYEDSRYDIRLSLRTADRHRARELGAALAAASGGVRMLIEEHTARRGDERPSEAELQAIAKAEFQNQLARYCDIQREHPRHRTMHSAANRSP